MYLVTKRQQSYIRTLFSIPFHCLNILLGKFSTEIFFGKKHTPPSVNLNGQSLIQVLKFKCLRGYKKLYMGHLC